MYKIVVGETGKNGKRGQPLAAENCRISALSSADYCLRNRVDVAFGRITWKGNRKEISRLFEAERLNSTVLESLDSGKEYTVLFLGCA